MECDNQALNGIAEGLALIKLWSLTLKDEKREYHCSKRGR